MNNTQEFKDRLLKLRNELNVKSKEEMSKMLDISRSYYSMLERGERTPSKAILNKLFILTNLPEEYWLYGITDESEYLSKRKNLKCTHDAIEQLMELGLLDPNKEWEQDVINVIISGLRADIAHIELKRKQGLK